MSRSTSLIVLFAGLVLIGATKIFYNFVTRPVTADRLMDARVDAAESIWSLVTQGKYTTANYLLPRWLSDQDIADLGSNLRIYLTNRAGFHPEAGLTFHDLTICGREVLASFSRTATVESTAPPTPRPRLVPPTAADRYAQPMPGTNVFCPAATSDRLAA